MTRGPATADRDALRLEPAASAADWDEAAKPLDGYTAFHRHDFLSAVAGPLSCRFVPMLVMQGDTPVGLAPQLVKAVGPVAALNIAPFPYLGPLVPEHLVPGVLELQRASARRSRVIFEWEVFANVVPADSCAGYVVTTDRTFVAPVRRTDDELLAAMHSRGRAHIRRAESSGVVVDALRREDLATAHAWHAERMRAQQMPEQYPLSALYAVYDLFADTGDGLMAAARQDGRLLAAQISLAGRTTTYGWFGLQDPSASPLQPMAALIWDVLRRSREAGYEEFDFVGAPTKEIAAYKAKFGTVERQYTVLQRATATYRAARVAVDRLGWPPSLARRT